LILDDLSLDLSVAQECPRILYAVTEIIMLPTHIFDRFNVMKRLSEVNISGMRDDLSSGC
jgi:hypothetical protein